jgi:ATP-dependent protease ClpP protease subunit
MERDKFMNPVEAKAFGLIDTVLEHPPKMHSDEHKPLQRAAGTG